MSTLLPSRNPNKPTHDDIATFLSTFLPPAPRPRDVEYFYHVPPQYMAPRAPVPTTIADVNAPVTAAPPNNSLVSAPSDPPNNAPILPSPPRRKNNTPVSHLTLSITPTPGVYTSLLLPSPHPHPTRSSLFPRSTPSAAASIAFIHRPWALDRWKVPRGTTVLSSHTGFDETLTVGWNVWLAGRMGVDVGERGEGTDGVVKEEGWKCVCLKGYKGDESRRIGLVGGFGVDDMRASTGGQLEEARQGIDAEDEDGGVRLENNGDHAGMGTTDGVNKIESKVQSVASSELLARVEREFAGIGEVFAFLPNASQNEVEMSKSDKETGSIIPPVQEFPVNLDSFIMDAIPPTLIPPSDPALKPETTRKPPKRQKKAPPVPPPVLPPSIPLANAHTDSSIPDRYITAVAIMNAFHPEEVERAVSAAYAGGWIDWRPVGLPQEVKGADAATQHVSAAGETTMPGASQDTMLTKGTGTVPMADTNTALLANTDTLPAATIDVTPVGSGFTNGAIAHLENSLPAIHSSQPTSGRTQGSILMLTGAPRAPGLVHVQKHYADKVIVVCVGHAACEEWGIKSLAEQCRQKWPGLEVREIFEEEVIIPREKKMKKQEAEVARAEAGAVVEDVKAVPL